MEGGGRQVISIAAAVGTAAAGLIAAVQLVGVVGGDDSGATVTHPTTTRPGITGTPTLDAVDSALASLRKANLAFHAPRELGLEEEAEVRLVVSVRQSIEELKDEIEELGEAEGARVEVSDVMVADLSGLDFRIEEITPATQIVDSEGSTQWRWLIAPTETGTLRLFLSLNALISVNGTERPYSVETFETVLTIEVSWTERLTGFVSDNWQWLWTTLLFPLLVVLWRRSKRPGPPAAQPKP